VTNKMAAIGRARIRLGLVPLSTLRVDSLRIDAKILAARGLTHDQIAQRLDVHRTTVSRWLA